jgi:hydrogenase maturation protease
MSQTKSIALIGIGNPLRADDGIAHWVCNELEKLQLPGIEIFAYHQLQTDLIESWLSYDELIIVDAAIETKGVMLETLENSTVSQAASSHHIDPATIKGLIKQLYNKDITIKLCKIEVNNFTLGDALSDLALANGAKAITFLRDELTHR